MIKPIEQSDYAKFRRIINQYHSETLAFEFCNGYIVQATRNFPRVFHYNKDTLVFFTKKTKKATYVIVCSAGRNRLKAVEVLAKRLAESSKNKVIIKNVDESLVKLKRHKGFREYKKSEIWDKDSKYDDNTYPQVISRVKDSIGLEGSQFREWRKELYRFDRKFDISVRNYNYSQKPIFRRILNKWAKQISAKLGVDKKEVVQATQIFGDNRRDFFQYLIYENITKKYVGFMCFSIISKSCLGGNALINDFDFKQSYKKFAHEGAKIAAKLRFPYLNIQGAETRKQFEAKKRFIPKFLIKRKHLIFEK